MGKVAALMLVAVLGLSCSPLPDRRTVAMPDGGSQDRYCRGLDPEVCDRAVDRALTFVPDMAASPKAVVATVDRPGANDDIIVAFAPFGDSEVWSPPVLRVDRERSPHWHVDYWKSEPVPEAFRELMTAAGLDPP